MRIRVCWYKNAGVAGYAEAFRPVQSDSQTSEWYSYFENDVLGTLSVWKSAKTVQKNLKLAADAAQTVRLFLNNADFQALRVTTTPANAPENK